MSVDMTGFPFDSVDAQNPDRLWDSEDWTNYFRTIVGDGILLKPLEDSVGNYFYTYISGGNKLIINPGKISIDGHFGELISQTDPQEVGSLTGNIMLVARLDLTVANRKFSLEFKNGSQTQDITKTDDIKELCLYTFNFDGSVITNLTDRRANSDFCGISQYVQKQMYKAVYDDMMFAPFQQNHSYPRYAGCFNNSKVYRAKNSFTSTSTFNSSDWDLIYDLTTSVVISSTIPTNIPAGNSILWVKTV